MITLPRSPLKGSGERDPAATADARSRRRFAAPAVAAALAGLALRDRLGAPRGAGGRWHLAGVRQLRTDRASRSRSSGDSLLTEQQVLTAADVPPGAHLAQLDLERDPGAGRGAGSGPPVDVSRAWPDGVRIEVDRAHPGRRGGARRAVPRRSTPTAWCSATTPSRPRGCRVISTGRRQQRRPHGGRPVIAALPSGLAGRVDHVAGGGRRPDHAGAARRRGGGVGERGAVRRSRPRCSTSCSHRPAHTYDVSVPGQPSPAPRQGAERASPERLQGRGARLVPRTWARPDGAYQRFARRRPVDGASRRRVARIGGVVPNVVANTRLT